MNFDWGGTQDELKAMVEALKKGCNDCEGIDFKGLYAPNNTKWHYTMFWETDDYFRWRDAMQIAQEKYGSKERNYNKTTHATFELWVPYNYPT